MVIVSRMLRVLTFESSRVTRLGRVAHRIRGMWDRFAPRLRKSIFGALELAGQRGQHEASAEHLLIVIARDDDSAAAFILDRAGIDRLQLIAAIESARPSAS